MKARLIYVLISAVLMLAGCKDDYMTETQAQQWIAAYAPEVVDPHSTIRIEPTDSLKELLNGRTSLEDVFSFSPNLKGEAGFSDGGRYVEFCPEEGQLKEGREYECHIDMAKLSGVDTLKDFLFRFRVARREAKMEGVRLTIDSQDIGNAIVSGKLVFSHPIDASYADSRLLSTPGHKGKV